MKRLTTDKFVSIIDHNDLEVFLALIRLEIMLVKVLLDMFIKLFINQMGWLLLLRLNKFVLLIYSQLTFMIKIKERK